MDPNITTVSEENNQYRFTLRGINVSLANALRRTILSDIPTTVILTENYKDNQCNIVVNTSRLHNEILKQRLSCIPIHEKDTTVLPGNYILEVDVKNETGHITFVTTEDFKIKNKTSEKYVTESELRRIFPPCLRTNQYIDFARLRPGIGDTIPGEQLKLTAEFSVGTAKMNSMFNVVSKCAYGNTKDAAKISAVWEREEDDLRSKGVSQADLEFEKKNFYALDAERQFVPDSFDFVIESVGVYENKEIVRKACEILIVKLTEFISAIDSDIVPINNSETTMNFCFDVILENEDYTIGKVLEYILYETFYEKEKIFTFCGFKKMHPHNPDSIIRIAYLNHADRNMVRQNMREAAGSAVTVFEKMVSLFA
jgi:DNA-directed RNA polymerase II subunit RPB3